VQTPAANSNPNPVPPFPTTGAAAHCLAGIHRDDPNGAHSLYQIYSASIRLYFRQARTVWDVEKAVYSALVEVVRAVRQLDIHDPEELTRTVQRICAQRIFETRKTDTANAMTLDRRGEIVNRMFTALNRNEREVLLRSCLLLQREQDIASEADVSLTDVRRAHAKARVLFRLCCEDLNATPPMMVV
jgi:hypothetical protein